MAKLEDLKRGASVRGIAEDGPVEVVDTKWHGQDAVTLTFKTASGGVGDRLVYRDDEPRLEILEAGLAWAYDSPPDIFKLVIEAKRISLAYLFDPLLAVHTSLIEPLPHQITAVYETMLRRQPLRFLLADDPGAGKTIMAGLLAKELIIRGDLKRCLIVCPGSLAEQWQDELYQRFRLDFEIISRESFENARTGNPFLEKNLIIARLDQLSRNEDIQEKLGVTDWDLIVCDEAHKMSATYLGNEVKYTKRYRLGQLLGGISRHLLLMTATPHNGKEADFQLFMALIDGDRFEGKFRDGVHTVDVSDLMRRLVKEQMYYFDGRPLFPERRAYTVSYDLSDPEARLYADVTNYVREEMNRADRLRAEGEGRRGNMVGFALMILQRRLASSPEAIWKSLERRIERLEKRLREEQLIERGESVRLHDESDPTRDIKEDFEDIDDFDEETAAADREMVEETVVDLATAARTIAELKNEIVTLKRLERLAANVHASKTDKKWEKLSEVLQDNPEMFDAQGHRRKLIIFTEHKDTLNYLVRRIGELLGTPEAIVTIHGGVGREDRRKAQDRFTQDKDVSILVATDAAAEGINLQRAHLMVNFDLPWNPNRIEQRFGRIHRIGQTEVCHVWSLVANGTREGEVFLLLLKKLDAERKALGGQVFDVLGQLFREESLRELLLQAIRYGDQPEVKARLTKSVEGALDREHIKKLIESQALAKDSMDTRKVREVREELERADARRLQPHFVSSYFREAFRRLGGTIHEREPRRFEITHVPAVIRQRDRLIGVGSPVQPKYERITFHKEEISVAGQPLAEFVCPGHPLLDCTSDIILERHAEVMKRGTVLVDRNDPTEEIRVLFCLEHSIRDARRDRSGNPRIISRRLQFVEIDETGGLRHAGYAPHLDYEALGDGERELVEDALSADWLRNELDEQVIGYAVEHVVPDHMQEVRDYREKLIEKTAAAVKKRLTTELTYWDHRAEELKAREQAGRTPKLNSAKARQRADELETRLQTRMKELEEERRISAAPPNVTGGAIVIPGGLLARLKGKRDGETAPAMYARERERVEKAAINAVMEAERRLGFEPKSVEDEKRGYDIESSIPDTGKLRFIEVKGRVEGAETVTVTKNEILTGFNKPEDFILAIGIVPRVEDSPEGDIFEVAEGAPEYGTPGGVKLYYVRRPFTREPDFAVTSVNYKLKELLANAEEPR